MQQQPASCEGCYLHDNRIGIGFQRPEGTGSRGLLVVAEALGEREAQDDLPLRPNAPAGSVFQGIIRRISGLDRNQLLISNTIWCRPGTKNWLDGSPYEFPAIEHCQRHNQALIKERRPRAILTLGSIPTRTITGLLGYNQGIKLIRGFILKATRPEYFVDGKPLPVIATYHPSFLLRASKTRSKDKENIAGKVEKAEGGMSLSGVVRRDIELALRIAQNGPPEPYKFSTVVGDRDAFRRLIERARAHPELPLAWDIETPRSIDMAADESEIDSIQAQVTQIQFALDSQEGYVFPGFREDWVREGSRAILELPNTKLTWNGWKFDNKVVGGHYGMPINGQDIDLMSAWAWLQPDLPKGLQFATSFYAPELPPWKHLAIADEELYGACDVISLQINHEGIFGALRERGLLNSYERHVLKLREIMIDTQHRGVPVNPERHKEFGDKIKSQIIEIGKQINDLIPEEVLGLEPKRKPKETKITEFGYVKIPPKIKEFLDEAGNPKNGTDRIVIQETEEILDDEGTPTGETEEVQTTYTRRVVRFYDKKAGEFISGLRWVRLKPFSVNSSPQKIDYIKFRRGQEIAERLSGGQDLATAERLAKYKVPQVRNKQKEMKDNAGVKELERLFKITDDPVFRLLIEISKLKKMYSTYVEAWLVKRDGERVSPEALHTTFGVADTGTGQLSSRDPNVQNIPKHGPLAKEIRFAIQAKPGKVLIEIDKKGFHAATLAREAKDKKYARMAALDVHSYMTAFRLKLPEAPMLMSWSDRDLEAWFKMKRKESFVYKNEAVPQFPDGLTFDQVRDYKTKRIVHGLGFSQGARSIFEQHPENFKSIKDVQGYIELFFGEFTRIRPFQREITQLAHKQTYLISLWNYIRRFHDVFQWDSGKWNEFSGSYGDWRQGDDYEAAVAFLPANHAFGMIKEEMLRLAGYRIEPGSPVFDSYINQKKIWAERVGEDLLARYGFCNQLHDALFFHCDEKLKDKALEDVVSVMREPCLTLADPEMAPDGLFVDSEASVGYDWSHLDKVSL